MSLLVKERSSQADALNRFKQSFNKLSGKEVNVAVFAKIEKFQTFVVEMHKFMLRFKQVVEKAMTNKVELDNAKMKCLFTLADIEELISSEIPGGMTNGKMRAEQRVLAKYKEVNNDTHWRLLESIDDFVRD